MKKSYSVDCFSDNFSSIEELEEELIRSYLHDNLIDYGYAISVLKRINKYLVWLHDIMETKTYNEWAYERKGDLIFKLSAKIEDILEEENLKKEELFNTVKYIIEPFYDAKIWVYDENDDCIDELCAIDLPNFSKKIENQPYTAKEIELCENFCEKYYKDI